MATKKKSTKSKLTKAKNTTKAAKKTAKKAAKKAVKKAVKKMSIKAKLVKGKKRVALSAGQGIQVGGMVPQMSLPVTGGKRLELGVAGARKTVLYFYPKDATPGCTIEGHEFTKLHDQFSSLNTEIYGVSRDNMKSHEKFKEKECYTIDLVSDESSALCNAFGVIKEKNMYGKKVLGIERSTFVIDSTGRVERAWRGVKAEGHAQEVLEYLKGAKEAR